MIESVTFRNFRVLQSATLALGRFTLIVGPNGSGKSTALQAFAAVRWPGNQQFQKLASVSVAVPAALQVKVVLSWAEPHQGVSTKSTWEAGATQGPVFRDSQDQAIPGGQLVQTLLERLERVRVFALEANAITARARSASARGADVRRRRAASASRIRPATA